MIPSIFIKGITEGTILYSAKNQSIWSILWAASPLWNKQALTEFSQKFSFFIAFFITTTDMTNLKHLYTFCEFSNHMYIFCNLELRNAFSSKSIFSQSQLQTVLKWLEIKPTTRNWKTWCQKLFADNLITIFETSLFTFSKRSRKCGSLAHFSASICF